MLSQYDSLVFLVDDDPSVRRSVTRLIQSAGYSVQVFESADEFLKHGPVDLPSCLVLDIRMPGLTGMDLQEALVGSGHTMPIIFISGHADVPMSIKAMKRGAFDFLPKPFHDEDLLSAIEKALEKDVRQRELQSELQQLEHRMKSLTPREYEVFAFVVKGMLNKQIAAELGISEKTIKVHRARVMEKMKAGSLAELVQFAERIERRP
jgi:two-component system response regulator FixJ